MNAEQLWSTTMDPDSRMLKKVILPEEKNELGQLTSEWNQTEECFMNLMGDDVLPRKDFIQKNALYADIDA